MRKAIWLDDRERDLARRIFDYACYSLSEKEPITGGFGEMAIRWTKKEVSILAQKFEEPPTETEDSGA